VIVAQMCVFSAGGNESLDTLEIFGVTMIKIWCFKDYLLLQDCLYVQNADRYQIIKNGLCIIKNVYSAIDNIFNMLDLTKFNVFIRLNLLGTFTSKFSKLSSVV
ncbi:unnamed protein product, partial [Meganyctiphanes norvegica]